MGLPAALALVLAVYAAVAVCTALALVVALGIEAVRWVIRGRR